MTINKKSLLVLMGIAALVPLLLAVSVIGSGRRETSTQIAQPYVSAKSAQIAPRPGTTVHSTPKGTPAVSQDSVKDAHASQAPNSVSTKCASAQDACPPPDAPPVLPLTGKTIMLDAGHGGTDTGAVRDSINEKDINLQVTLKVRDALVKQGATVILTRDNDSTLGLQERVALIAQHNPTLFVSIHTNAHTNAGIDGIEAYYYNDASPALAKSIYQAVVDGLGERGNWVRQRELAVVHHELCPATLIEIGYLSNRHDRNDLVKDDYQSKVANSIYKGILDFVTNPNSGSSTPTKTGTGD